MLEEARGVLSPVPLVSTGRGVTVADGVGEWVGVAVEVTVSVPVEDSEAPCDGVPVGVNRGVGVTEAVGVTEGEGGIHATSVTKPAAPGVPVFAPPPT